MRIGSSYPLRPLTPDMPRVRVWFNRFDPTKADGKGDLYEGPATVIKVNPPDQFLDFMSYLVRPDGWDANVLLPDTCVLGPIGGTEGPK